MALISFIFPTEDTENCNKPLVETVITDVEISADDLTPNNENEAENGVCKHGNPSENDVSESREKVLYKLEDIPPWYLTLLFGFQVTFFFKRQPFFCHCIVFHKKVQTVFMNLFHAMPSIN